MSPYKCGPHCRPYKFTMGAMGNIIILVLAITTCTTTDIRDSRHSSVREVPEPGLTQRRLLPAAVTLRIFEDS